MLSFDIDKEYEEMNEEELKSEIQSMTKESGLFVAYREVWGRMTNVHPIKNSPSGNLKLDLLLFPTTKLIKRGWKLGAVAVEVKGNTSKDKSNVISQLLDYHNCVFTIENHGKLLVQPSFGVVFPFNATGAAASVLSQAGCGTSTIKRGNMMFLQNGLTRTIEFNRNGDVLKGTLDFISGLKTGNRG